LLHVVACRDHSPTSDRLDLDRGKQLEPAASLRYLGASLMRRQP